MLPTLTEREKRILFFLRMFQHKHRYSPSPAEIGSYFGVERQTIAQACNRLRKKGYLEISNHKIWQRRIFLMPKGMDFPWGNEQLPDELFDHMKKEQPQQSDAPDNGI